MSHFPTIITGFLVMAMVLVAPHLDWPTARYTSIMCIVFALLFLFIDMGSSK